jgi:hypothetical protein
MKEKIKIQLRNLMSDCTYNAETHHSIASRSIIIDFWSRLVPAALTGLLSAWEVYAPADSKSLMVLILVLAIITAITNILGAKSKSDIHLIAAKKFTKIKKLCNQAIEIDLLILSESESAELYGKLLQSYLVVVEEVPPTENWAFKKAQKRIQIDKVHEPD